MNARFSPEQRANATNRLTSTLASRSIAELRQMAKLWGWPVKGAAKAALVEAIVARLSDPAIMSQAFNALPPVERQALVWLFVLPGRQSPEQPLAAVLSQSSGKGVAEVEVASAIQDLYARGLLQVALNGTLGVPPLYAEWLPELAPAGLIYHKRAERLPALSAAALSLHVDNLLSLVEAELPEVAVSNPTPGGYGEHEVVPGKGPVGAETLRQWGYATLEEQHMARFLLTMLMEGDLVRLSQEGGPVRLAVDAEAVAVWQTLSPSQQQLALGQLWFQYMTAPETRAPANVGWTEIDLALEFHRQQRSGIGLQRLYYGYAEPTALSKILSSALILVAGSTEILQADTWYSFERYCDLLRAYSTNLIGMTTRGDSVQFTARSRSLNAANMDPSTWLATYGSLVAAWLTGTGRWLGRIEIALKDGKLAAFQRPDKTRASPSVALPADTVRFLPNGQILVRTIWQAAEMRELVRQIASLATRDRMTMTFRLDPAAFRLALRRGATAAEIIEAFASLGFPLPADAAQRIKLWESRAGRFRIYDQVAAIEFGDDLAQREVESAAGLGQRQAHSVSSRCSLLLDPAAVPDIIEALQRRGYIPKVLP